MFDSLFQWINTGCDLLLLTQSGILSDFVNRGGLELMEGGKMTELG